MTVYNDFVGIDIGKYNFVVAFHYNRRTKEYENTPYGIATFIKECNAKLRKSLCIVENTGGYETRLLLTLCDLDIAVHRADARKVKFFIRSFGNGAKTDALDAKALALYGSERHKGLPPFAQLSKKQLFLYELVMRRQDLNQMLIAEKNRAQAPRVRFVTQSCVNTINCLLEELDSVNAEIDDLIAQDEALREKKRVLKTIPGIGDIIASSLIALIPELGSMSRRQVASLVGLAPRACDSGTIQGYRRTSHGRQFVKPLLFMAAMAARTSHSSLREFFERLTQRGKKGKVVLVALMRKIIVIANARLKPFCTQPTDRAEDGVKRTLDVVKAAHAVPLISTPSFDVPSNGISLSNAPSTAEKPKELHSS